MTETETAGANPGWAALTDAGPVGQAGFAVIVLTCLALALRGAMPGAAIEALLARPLLAKRRPPE